MLRILIGLLEKGYATSVEKSIEDVAELLIFLERYYNIKFISNHWKLKYFTSHSEVAHRLNAQETTLCVQMIDRQLVVGAGSIISSLADKLKFSKVKWMQIFLLLY
jgi:hypothetical protein